LRNFASAFTLNSTQENKTASPPRAALQARAQCGCRRGSMITGAHYFLFQGGGNFLVQLIPIAFIFVIFYFLVILPQRKRQKETEEMLNNLKNGDKVVTQGGIFGTVMSVNAKENVVQLQIAPSVKIEIARSSIVSVRNEKEKE
jgi:preprotein translocase subunit YajC